MMNYQSGLTYISPILSSIQWDNSAAESGALYTAGIPGNTLVEGQQLVVRLFGTIMNNTSAHTTLVNVKLAGNIVFQIFLPTIASAFGLPWRIETTMTVRTAGNPAWVWLYCAAMFNNVPYDQGNINAVFSDTTAAMDITYTAHFSAASAMDVFTIDQANMSAWY